MAKMILDTCSWIDIAKPRFHEILEELIEQVRSGNIILLSNHIVVDEWKRNKENLIKNVIDSIKSYAKSAMSLAQLLHPYEAEKLITLVEKCRTEEEKQITIANAYVCKVEYLIENSNKVKITDEVKLEVLHQALDKKAPFHNNKNNIADALIFFSAVDHMKKADYQFATDLFFISSNHHEFSDTADRMKLHPDLLTAYRPLHYFDNLARALQMKSELVDDIDEYHEYQLDEWIHSEREIARGK